MRIYPSEFFYFYILIFTYLSINFFKLAFEDKDRPAIEFSLSS